MGKKITGKYFVKNTLAGSYSDVTSSYNGVNILSVEGLDDLGEAVNVYNEQWITGATEDFMITTNSGTIVRKNVDIKVTFIVSERYTTNYPSANTSFDVQSTFDTFVSYMTNTDVWIASMYVGKEVHCVALDKQSVKDIKVNRGVNKSYILGEITLHALSKPTTYNGVSLN